MEIEESTYSERVVAFIDILGFKNHVNDSINRDNSINCGNFEKIQSALDLIIEIANIESPMNANREVTQFSDSIIISFLINERSEVFYTLIELLHLTMELLGYGFVIRGGITVGKCFHNKTRVFGPTVIQAIELEKEAKFPRIIVDKKVLEIGCKNHANHHSLEDELIYLKSLVKKDDDGQWYLNYFSSALYEVDDELSEFGYIHNLEKIIRDNLQVYKEDERVRPKYEWMKSKYNDMVAPMIEKDNIDRFGYGESNIRNGLESLSLII